MMVGFMTMVNHRYLPENIFLSWLAHFAISKDWSTSSYQSSRLTIIPSLSHDVPIIIPLWSRWNHIKPRLAHFTDHQTNRFPICPGTEGEERTSYVAEPSAYQRLIARWGEFKQQKLEFKDQRCRFVWSLNWLVVLTILKHMKVNGKDCPIYYGK